MYKRAIGTLFFAICLSVVCYGQENVHYSSKDSLNNAVVCDRIHVESKSSNALSKRDFAAAEPYFLRSYNSKEDFAAVQLGKRNGSKVFLYIKIFRFNTCIKNNEALEVTLENGITYFIKNKMSVNCKGDLVVELNNSDIKELVTQPISSFKVLSFQKDFEFHLNSETATKIRQDLECLAEYKF